MATRKPTLTAEDKMYRARSDAETLARAHEIMSDKERHGAAQKHAAGEAKRYARAAGGQLASSPLRRARGK